MTRVLVAEESPFLCRLVSGYLEEAGGFHVVGTARTGRDALLKFRALAPDVVALDLTMPDLDGVAVLREMMSYRRAPVVAFTGASGLDTILTLQALEAGATDFVAKFDPDAPKSAAAVRDEIVSKMRRAARTLPFHAALAPIRPPDLLLPGVAVIGASTGGPQAVRELLSALPSDFSGAVVVVEHMPAIFSERFTKDLARFSPLPVAELREDERLQPGTVRIAPGGAHLVFEAGRRISFRQFNGEANCPSIDMAMESAAAIYGPDAVGVLLTGMGADGAHGMGVIRHRGGRTLAQDPATCVVAGMPGAAIARGVVDYVAAPGPLGTRLAALFRADKGVGNAS